MGPINGNCAEIIFYQMASAHHFIDISQNILNLWMRLIFPETRHPGVQFEHKNETTPNGSKELSNLEHSPCFYPIMWFLNIITFHFLIAFENIIWQCSKMVVQKITSCSLKKKKKIILFQNPVLLNYVLTWSSMTEVRRQPCRGLVPFTETTLENKVKTVWQNCLGAC